MIGIFYAIIVLAILYFVIAAVVRQYKNGTTQRPIILTIMCLIIFIIGGIFIIATFSVYDQVTKQVGSGLVLSSTLLTIGGLIGAIGIWQMKKWGGYLYVGAQGISLLISLIDKENFVMMKEMGYVSLVIQALCIGVVLFHFKKFTD
jgi:hypothetical protein